MKIGEIAHSTGLSIDILRFYEYIDFIDRPTGPRPGDYDAAVPDWITFLTRLNAISMTLADRFRYADLLRKGDGIRPNTAR